MGRILLIDDHPVLRAGLAANISRQVLGEVIEAGTAEEGLSCWRRGGVGVVLLDLSLPDRSGFDLLEEARSEGLEAPVMVLSAFNDHAYRLRAQSLGAVAFVCKSVPLDELASLVAAVLARRAAAFTALPAQRSSRRPSLGEPLNERLTMLSPAERKVLELLGRNLTSREISVAQGISVRTVENHRANICRKLELRGPHRLLEVALSLVDAAGSTSRTREP